MSVPLSDDELLRGFADATLPKDAFHHLEHVRVAWLHLRRHPPVEALRLFSERLRLFATAQGAPRLYHETITWAFVLLIHERMRRSDAASWEAFAAANADLLDRKTSILKRYYRDETLGSELAREVFVFPDRELQAGAP